MPFKTAHANRPYKANGRWFRPNAESDVVPGVFSYHPRHQVRLKLNGMFGEGQQSPFPQPDVNEKLAVICGEAQDGDLITIFDTFKIGTNISSSGYPATTYFGHLALVGTDRCDSLDSCDLRAVDIHLSHIEAWFNRKVVVPSFNHTDHSIAMTATPLEDVNVRIDHIAATLLIRSTVMSNISLSRAGFNHMVTFRLLLDQPGSIKDILQRVRDVQNLLSLFVGQPVTVTEIILRKEAPSDSDPAKPADNRLLVGELHDPVDSKDAHAWEMLLPCDVFEPEEFAWVCRQYFETLECIGDTLRILIGIQAGTYRFVQNRFLTLTQSLEGLSRLIKDEDTFYVPAEQYDKIRETLTAAIPSDTPSRLKQSLTNKLLYGNEVALRQRINLLAKRIPESLRHLLDDTVPAFAKRVADVRNALIHSNWATTTPPTNTQYYEINLRLELVIVSAILRAIGVCPTVVATRIPMARRFKELVLRTPNS